MSGHGFHVHGPHDHEIEHAAQHGAKDSFTSNIAVMTAVLATIGALFSYMGGATQANAGLYKNNAAIALLTRRGWLGYAVGGVALIGVGLGGMALAHV